LEEKELKPLGETRTHHIDVRVMAATNKNLREKMASSQFRVDLYHRLNVVSVSTPSLREIPEDIPLIANHFLSMYCSEYMTSPKRFSEDTVRMLTSRRWSGNVRQLRNDVRRAVIFSKSEIITPQDFQSNSRKALHQGHETDDVSKHTYKEARRSLLEKFNLNYISELLKECNGNVSLAAKKAQLERQSLQHLMRKYGITSEEFRGSANKI